MGNKSTSNRIDRFFWKPKHLTVVTEQEIQKSVPDNPAKKVVEIHGIKIGVEWPKGSVRFANTDHPVKMKADYGYVSNTEADEDGMAIDIYIGPDRHSKHIFKLTQLNSKTGDFDEYKYMLGYNTRDQAVESYLEHMPLEFYGGCIEIEKEDLEHEIATHLKDPELAKALGQERGPRPIHKYLRREKDPKTGKWTYIYKETAPERQTALSTPSTVPEKEEKTSETPPETKQPKPKKKETKYLAKRINPKTGKTEYLYEWSKPAGWDWKGYEDTIDRVMERGGLRPYKRSEITGKRPEWEEFTEIPLYMRRKRGKPPDEMAAELGMTEKQLFEEIKKDRQSRARLLQRLAEEKIRTEEIETVMGTLQNIEPVEMVTGDMDLKVGDKVFIGTEYYEVKSKTDEYTELANGERIIVDSVFGVIPVVGGMYGIKRAETISKAIITNNTEKQTDKNIKQKVKRIIQKIMDKIDQKTKAKRKKAIQKQE